MSSITLIKQNPTAIFLCNFRKPHSGYIVTPTELLDQATFGEFQQTFALPLSHMKGGNARPLPR